jgi:phosphoribosyl 1,2-cyclic phosphodiesterase
MLIRSWGSRGSIPVSGREYLKYGGDTTCVEIRSGDGIVIVDAGTGIRRLGNELVREGVFSYDLIFTHAHWDHLMGFPFFKPLYRKGTKVRIHGCPFAAEFAEGMLSKIMSAPNFPVDYTDIRADLRYIRSCPGRFEIEGLAVEPIPISHPNQGSGFKFSEDGKSFVFLTDNELEYVHPGGLGFDDYVNFARGADLLIHDAEYTEEECASKRTWGHSSYRSALELAVRAGVGQLGLFHLNQDRGDEEMDRIVEECRSRIKEAASNLECFAIGYDTIIEI